MSTERELLEILVKKIDKMEGGSFQVLSTKIDTLQKKQEETSDKLDRLSGEFSNKLYDPSEGLFSRIKAVEVSLDDKTEKLLDKTGQITKKMKAVPDIKVELEDLQKFKTNVEQVAGNQLQELHGLVSLKRNISKIYWAGVLAVVGFFGNVLMTVVRSHH